MLSPTTDPSQLISNKLNQMEMNQKCFLKVMCQKDYLQTICQYFSVFEVIRYLSKLSLFHYKFLNNKQQKKFLETLICNDFSKNYSNLSYETDENEGFTICKQIDMLYNSWDYFIKRAYKLTTIKLTDVENGYAVLDSDLISLLASFKSYKVFKFWMTKVRIYIYIYISISIFS